MNLSWLRRDKEIRKELLARYPEATRRLLNRDGLESVEAFSGEEAIVLLRGRPVLFVQDATFQLPEDATDTWSSRLGSSKKVLDAAIPSIGRINVCNHPSLDWVGTAWLVADGVVATNRHVAREFAARSGSGFVFRSSTIPGKTIGAKIDFKEEYGRPNGKEILVSRVLFIADDDGPDVGLLALEKNAGKPLPLASAVRGDEDVATVGYPARDSRNPSGDMERIFGTVYDVKRLAPGRITSSQLDVLQHDCTTLGGNSGSAVIDLATGAVLGLHFGGKPMLSNYAVPAPLLTTLVEANRP